MTLNLTVFAENRTFRALTISIVLNRAFASAEDFYLVTKYTSGPLMVLFSSGNGKLNTAPTIISPKEYTVSLCPPRISSLRFAFVLLCCLQVNGVAEYVHAEKVSTEKWNISADKMVRYESPNSIVAQGNVVLEKKEQYTPPPPRQDAELTSWSVLLEEKVKEPEKTAKEVAQKAAPEYRTTVTIKSDWMVYDVELESIKAKGNVQITTNDDQLSAKEATLNLTNETGKFTDATVVRKELSMHLEGKTIEKTGFDTYRVIDGWVITCKVDEGETPPWSIASADADVRQGGYAELRHATFNIRNVPVFYLPYMVVPAKNTRQSGFLFPEFSSSGNNGFGFNLPLFLNISDSSDATFFPEYYVKRGVMPGAEFRYVSDVKDKGMFTASFLDDQLSDPSETDYYNSTGYTHDNSQRYWVRGKADHTFADAWQTRLDLDIVSDQDYLREFDSGSTGYEKTYNKYLKTFGRAFQNQTDTQRQNSLKTLRSWSGMSLEANLLAIDDASTFASDTNTPLWKLPNVIFSGALPIADSTFSVDWNADYVDYWREDGVGGHRFDIRPTISAPIPLSAYLESRAEVGLRETYYVVQTYGDAEWENDNSQNRLLPEFETEVATTLERDFYLGDSDAHSFAHQIRPYVKYGYIPDVDQKELPKFDSVDTIGEKNAITYGVDNFFNVFGTTGKNQETIRQAASLKIEQYYDLRSEMSDEPFGPLYGKLTFNVFDGASLNYKTYYDVYDNTFTIHTLGGEYSNSRGDHLSLDYSYNEIQNIEQINAKGRAQIVSNWFAGAEVQRSLAQDETNKANGSLIYQALCWSIQFETRYTPADTTYLVLFNLTNIGSPLGISL